MSSVKKVFKGFDTQRLVAVLALIVLYIFFSVAGPNFFQYSTLISIFDSAYYIGFMAIGVTFVIITGGIDLSIGTVCICCSLIGGTLLNSFGVPMVVVLLLTLAIGTLIGLANGLMVSVMGLPAFIATLGTMMITRGFGSIVTGTASVTFPQGEAAGGWFRNIFKFKSASFGGQLLAGVPTGFILLIVCAVIMGIVLTKTRPGRYILAIGSNKEATRLSGVNVVKWETLAYVFSGFFAAVAGISYAAVYSTLMPGTGNGFELDAIAGVVIGGTSLSGGSGSISGTLIGVFIMAVLKTGLPFVGLQPHYQLFITGFVLIIAVFADVMNRKKAAAV